MRSTTIFYGNKMCPNFLGYIITEDYKQELHKLLMNLDPLTQKINERKTGNSLKHFLLYLHNWVSNKWKK